MSKVVWIRTADMDDGNEVKLELSCDKYVSDIRGAALEKLHFGKSVKEGELVVWTVGGKMLVARTRISALTEDEGLIIRLGPEKTSTPPEAEAKPTAATPAAAAAPVATAETDPNPVLLPAVEQQATTVATKKSAAAKRAAAAIAAEADPGPDSDPDSDPSIDQCADHQQRVAHEQQQVRQLQQQVRQLLRQEAHEQQQVQQLLQQLQESTVQQQENIIQQRGSTIEQEGTIQQQQSIVQQRESTTQQQEGTIQQPASQPQAAGAEAERARQQQDIRLFRAVKHEAQVQGPTGDGRAQPSTSVCAAASALDPHTRATTPPPLLGDDMIVVYIDRVAPDLSDACLRAAVEAKVGSVGLLEVIRSGVSEDARTKHFPSAYAFAYLYPDKRSPETGTITVSHCDVSGSLTRLGAGEHKEWEEQVRVQATNNKQRSMPEPPRPRATLHIRVYARRRPGWSQQLKSIKWAGILALLEATRENGDGEEPPLTEYIKIIADDKGSKSLVTHSSMLLSGFFVECKDADCARKLKDKVSDRMVCCGGVTFLVQCDYTQKEKKLYDRCGRRDTYSTFYRKFQDEYDAAKHAAKHAVDVARESPELLQQMLHEGSLFEFSDKDDKDRQFTVYASQGDDAQQPRSAGKAQEPELRHVPHNPHDLEPRRGVAGISECAASLPPGPWQPSPGAAAGLPWWPAGSAPSGMCGSGAYDDARLAQMQMQIQQEMQAQVAYAQALAQANHPQLQQMLPPNLTQQAVCDNGTAPWPDAAGAYPQSMAERKFLQTTTNCGERNWQPITNCDERNWNGRDHCDDAPRPNCYDTNLHTLPVSAYVGY